MEQHIQFDHDTMIVSLLDQRLLPGEQVFFSCSTVRDVITALREMVVRGAPAIGVTAACGCVLAASEIARVIDGQAANREDDPAWTGPLLDLLAQLRAARPTAVNLNWAVDRMLAIWKAYAPLSLPMLIDLWISEAKRIYQEDIFINKQLGQFGAPLLDSGDTVMTHCNAGALATAGFGTALGVIYAAKLQGKSLSVIANETRPFLQGARLTAFELQQSGIPVTIACDNACALLMRQGKVDKVVVGADRIAANGDTANKIGTYGVALLARAHGIPFYVAAPLSTVDLETPDGSHIPIEERPAEEVTHIGSTRVTPEGVPVFNFAFDITPHTLIDGIITEAGICTAPYAASLAQAKNPQGK